MSLQARTYATTPLVKAKLSMDSVETYGGTGFDISVTTSYAVNYVLQLVEQKTYQSALESFSLTQK